MEIERIELKLCQLIEGLGCKVAMGNDHVDISGLETDSRKIKAGDLFICTKGQNFDGIDFVGEAIEKGALAVLTSPFTSKPLRGTWPKTITWITAEEPISIISHLASRFYNYPGNIVKVIGITGTKGKTTTCFMIQKTLNEAGHKCGLMGTVHIDDTKEIIPAKQTTPSAIDTMRYLRQMADNGCEYAVMEVSSQGLKKYRTQAIEFEACAITNISEDHIGPFEHENFGDYVETKKKILEYSQKAFVSADDEICREIFLKENEHRSFMNPNKPKAKFKTYGFSKDADYQIMDYNAIRLRKGLAVEYNLEHAGNKSGYTIPMAGKFSAMNGALATAICMELGLSQDDIRKGLATVKVPGRCEILCRSNNRMVVIDYAHNGDSMENLLGAMREYNPKGITVVFGCGGNRCKERRKNMAEAVAKGADKAIITSDNPRNEDPEDIIGDITECLEITLGERLDGSSQLAQMAEARESSWASSINQQVRNHLNWKVIPDRRQAIRFGIQNQADGEILIISGKGHEKYQIIGEKTYEFDDVKEAKLCIEE